MAFLSRTARPSWTAAGLSAPSHSPLPRLHQRRDRDQCRASQARGPLRGHRPRSRHAGARRSLSLKVARKRARRARTLLVASTGLAPRSDTRLAQTRCRYVPMFCIAFRLVIISHSSFRSSCPTASPTTYSCSEHFAQSTAVIKDDEVKRGNEVLNEGQQRKDC